MGLFPTVLALPWGGHLVADLLRQGYDQVRAVDIKPPNQWFQKFPQADNRSLDLREKDNCYRALENADRVVEKIRTFYEKPGLRYEIGERGREVFLEHFEQEACCDQWAELVSAECDGSVPTGTNGAWASDETDHSEQTVVAAG